MDNLPINYDDGSIIFREGDLIDAKYEVMAGSVDISCLGSDGFQRLALLQPGDIFDAADERNPDIRAATATALGRVTLRPVAISKPKSVGGGVIAMFNKILENIQTPTSTEKSEQPPPSIKMPDMGGAKEFIDQVFHVPDNSPAIEVLIAPLSGEQSGPNTDRLLAALGRRVGIHVYKTSHPIELPAEGSAPNRLSEFAVQARQLLIAEKGDLLIWGRSGEGGEVDLFFVSLAVHQEDIPGNFDLMTRLPLPTGFGPEYADLLYGLCFATTVPTKIEKKEILDLHLTGAMSAAVAHIEPSFKAMNVGQSAAIHLCLANAITHVAAISGLNDHYAQAITHYRTVIEQFAEDHNPLEKSMAQRHLGGVLQIIAEKDKQPELLNEAVVYLESSLTGLTWETFAWEWALVNNRLGHLYYRLDVASTAQNTLAKSLDHFSNALKIFNRNRNPRQWADARNGYAQAALVLGRDNKNIEVLQTAIKAFKSVLEVRRKGVAPLQWAATQNNLGSAHFMLGEVSRERESYEAAVESFELAHGVYELRNADKLAALTAKNLSKASNRLDTLLPRPRKSGK